MVRTRLSTTVDRDLLAEVRQACGGTTNAQLIDAALSALLARYRSAEIDQTYAAAYADHPIGELDEWGDLDLFRKAAATS